MSSHCSPPSPTFLQVRHTFFEHFCGGTSGASIQVTRQSPRLPPLRNPPTLTRPQSTVRRLQQQNVGAILDYAAEADVDPSPKQVRIAVCVECVLLVGVALLSVLSVCWRVCVVAWCCAAGVALSDVPRA